MSNHKGVAFSRLLFWGVILLVSMGVSLPFFLRPAAAADSDSDGLEDTFEAAFGTNPFSSDSDSDNLTDWEEIYIHGTHPLMPDSDGDSLLDADDPAPLDDGASAGGTTTPNWTYSSNLDKCPVPSSTAQCGVGVNAISGEVVSTLAVIDLGMGRTEHHKLVLTQLSGIGQNGPWGRDVICNLDPMLTEQGNGDAHIITPIGLLEFEEDNGDYTAPAGVFFDLTYDSQNSVFLLTAQKGGKCWTFADSDGHLEGISDRFGNTTVINRNQDREITSVDFPEGHSVDLETHATGRYSKVSDWSTPAREWEFTYNYYDELAKVTDPLDHTRQYFYINGSDTENLNGNLTRVLLPSGEPLMQMEYDEYDRVTKQTVNGNDLTLAYSGTYTDVTDFSGNNSRWTFTSGAVVPDSLIQYSNRDVRAGDPASWTTTFDHNSDFLLIEVVHAGGNRTDYAWDAYGCLTEIRKKATDTDADNNTTDLVSTFTYGSTYHQLEDSIDPNGETTERTLNGDELVTRIDYPDITHPTPDISIYETFTWNSSGQLVTRTDGEGVVTRNDYVASGTSLGLLWKTTVDYGVGTLNLVTERSYDSWRYLDGVEDPDGNQSVTLINNELGQVTKSTRGDSLGYEIEFVFSVDGYLSEKKVENVDETGTRDATTPWISTYYYPDPLGRPTQIDQHILPTTVTSTLISYGGNGETLQATLPEENVIKQIYDERGKLASRTRGFGTADASTEYWEYDGNLNLVSYTNGRGKEYEQDYNAYDQLEEASTPLGHYVSFVLDKNGNRTEIKRYNSSDTLLAHRKQYFDELNQTYKVEDWLDNTAPAADEWMATTIDRDKRGLVVLVTDDLDHETETTFDAARRKTRWEDHLGNKIDYGFTSDCCTATEIDQIEVVPGGGTQAFRTELVLDPLNRVTECRVVDRNDSNNKHITKWKYDFADFVKEQEDAEGNKTWYHHNGIGMLVKKEVDLGSEITTEYGYDDNLNLVLLTDDGGNETIYRYNARDVLEETEYDDGEKRTLTLLTDDLVGGWTDENGTVVVNTYDNDGRLTARAITRAQGVLGPTSEGYTWDGMRRLTEATNTNSTVQRSYDTLSRLLSETQGPNPLGQSGKTISYTWNDDGSRATAEYFSGYDLVYTSDALGRWTKIEDGSNNDLVTQSFYGPGFRGYQVDYLSGTQTTVGYDGFRMPTDIDHEDSGSTIFSGFDYAFDKVGNPMWVEFTHDSGKGNIYAYDKAYRLTSALMGSDDPSAEAADSDWSDYAYVEQLDFNMDDDSNRSSVVTTPCGQQSSTSSYTSDSLNQYTVIASVSQTHDDNGNLTDDGTFELSYDYRNNLIKVVSSSVVLSECDFDALGRRTRQVTVDGNYTTKYFYDGERVVEEYDGSDDLLKKFVYGQRIDEIRVMIAPDYADVDDDQDTTEILHFYYHHDMLGTVTHVTDENENVVESYVYTPYGQTTIKDGVGSTITSSDIENPYMFTARRMDGSTGLYHYRRRTYDPERGRFMQRDPMRSPPITLHQYVASRPGVGRDPLGLVGVIRGGEDVGLAAVYMISSGIADKRFKASLKAVKKKEEEFRTRCNSMSGQFHVQSKKVRVRAEINTYLLSGLVRGEGDNAGKVALITYVGIVTHMKRQDFRFICVAPHSNLAKVITELSAGNSAITPSPPRALNEEEASDPNLFPTNDPRIGRSVIQYETAQGDGSARWYGSYAGFVNPDVHGEVDWAGNPYEILPSDPDDIALGGNMELGSGDVSMPWRIGDWRSDGTIPRPSDVSMPPGTGDVWGPPIPGAVKGRGGVIPGVR